MSTQAPKPASAISEAEMLYWRKFCVGLFERIIDARLAGKAVEASVMPDIEWPDWSRCGLPTGQYITRITF